MRAMVLCVNGDGDVGVKAHIETPVMGRGECLEAAAFRWLRVLGMPLWFPGAQGLGACLLLDCKVEGAGIPCPGPHDLHESVSEVYSVRPTELGSKFYRQGYFPGFQPRRLRS
jgi:hypothetical protein